MEQSGTKRHCVTNTESEEKERDENQELQAELFYLDSFYKQSKKLRISQMIENYVNTHFCSCLLRAMVFESPLPNIPVLTAPTADNVIVDYVRSSFPSKPDMQLKHLQLTVNAAAAPILNLWAKLEEQELTTHKGVWYQWRYIVLECFQKTLVLLGNASNYISLNCRDMIIRRISQKSKHLGRLLNNACKKSKPEHFLLFT